MDKDLSDVTILVSSCDLYEDAWYPFFKLLHIQWPECSYDIVLNSESKNYTCNFLNIRTICSGKKDWSERLLECLKSIDTEFILFFLDDEFLQQPVNTVWWDKTVSYMREHKDVGVIFLKHSQKQKVNYGLDFFPRDFISKNFRIVGLSALYRKTYFEKLLRKHESPWEFESFASIRSKRMKEKVLQYSKFNPAIFLYDDVIQNGYGITARKWLPKNKELFEKYGIEVNFDNLGFLDLEAFNNSQKAKSVREKPKGAKEKLYIVKKRVLGLPKMVKKKIRKLKSMI